MKRRTSLWCSTVNTCPDREARAVSSLYGTTPLAVLENYMKRIICTNPATKVRKASRVLEARYSNTNRHHTIENAPMAEPDAMNEMNNE